MTIIWEVFSVAELVLHWSNNSDPSYIIPFKWNYKVFCNYSKPFQPAVPHLSDCDIVPTES